MSLPQINTPVHEVKIPSTGRKVKYRPFVVREEKILLLALESENQEEVTDAIIQIIGLHNKQNNNVKINKQLVFKNPLFLPFFKLTLLNFL